MGIRQVTTKLMPKRYCHFDCLLKYILTHLVHAFQKALLNWEKDIFFLAILTEEDTKRILRKRWWVRKTNKLIN